MSNKKVDVIIGYVSLVIQNLISFCLTPFMIICFGESQYGIYKYVLSYSTILSLANLGIGNSIVKYISEYRTNNDKENESKFIGFVIIIYSIISIVIIIASKQFYKYIPDILSSKFTNSEVIGVQSLFFLIIISSILNLYSSLFGGILRSYQKFSILKFINISSIIIKSIFVFCALLLGYKSLVVLSIDTITIFVVLCILIFICFKNLKIKVNIKKLDYKFISKILSFTILVFIETIAFQIFWGADNFILGSLTTASSISVYSIGVLLMSYFNTFSGVISEVIMPDVVRKINQDISAVELTNEMIKVGRIKLMSLGLLVVGLIFLGRNFIILWVGNEFTEAYKIILITILPQFLAGLQDVASYALMAKNKQKVRALTTFIAAILNIVITFILVERIGIIGAAIGTAFAYTLSFLVFSNIYYKKLLGIDIIRFLKETFKGMHVPIIIISIFSITISRILSLSIINFIIQIISVSIVYLISMYLIACNENEKNMIKSMVKFNKYKKIDIWKYFS